MVKRNRKDGKTNRRNEELLEMEKRIAKAAFFITAALKYDLFAVKQINDLVNELGSQSSKKDLLNLIKRIYNYFCGVTTFYHMVYGKKLETLLLNKVNEAFPKSVSYFLDENRFIFSYERVNYLLGLTKFITCPITFITNIKMKSENSTASWTEFMTTSHESVDANNVQVEVFIRDRMIEFKRKFDELFYTILPNQKILFEPKSYNLISFQKCSVTINGKPVDLTFDPKSTFNEIIDLTYAAESSFESFMNSIWDGRKEIQCSAFNKPGWVLNKTEHLYYARSKRSNRIADDASEHQEEETDHQEEEETQKQDDMGVNSNTHIQDDIIGVQYIEEHQDMSLMSRNENYSSSSASSSSSEVITGTRTSTHDEAFSSSSSSSAIEMIIIDEEYSPDVFEDKTSTYIVDAIINQRQFKVGEIRKFIKSRVKHNSQTNLVEIYLNIYKFSSQKGRVALQNQPLDKLKPSKQTPTGEVSYGKSELDQAMDSMTKQIKRYLYSIAEDQIEEFFSLLIFSEEETIKRLITATRFLEQEDNAKWTEIESMQLKYRDHFEDYRKLAARLSDDHVFLVRNPVEYSSSIKKLMKLFEKCIPIGWGRLIKQSTAEIVISSTEMEQPQETLVPTSMATEETEEIVSPTIQQPLLLERGLVTRNRLIPFVPQTSNWKSASGPKRKANTPATKSTSKKPRTPEKTANQETTVAVEDKMKHIEDEIDQIFDVKKNTVQLSKTKKVISLLLEMILCIEDKEGFLCGKRMWDFSLPNDESSPGNDDRDVSFARAHYNMYEKLVTGSTTSVPLNDAQLVEKLYEDAETESIFEGDETYNKYKNKVESLRKRIVLREEEEEDSILSLHFNEEDLGFPFLYAHLHKVESLKFFVLEEQNRYKLVKMVNKGQFFHGPFRFTDVSKVNSMSIFFSPIKTWTGTNVDFNTVVEEFTQLMSEVVKRLDTLQDYIRINELRQEDITSLFSRLMSFTQDKETVLHKSENIPGMDLQERKPSMSLSIETVKAIQNELLEHFQQEEENKIMEIFGKYIKLP